MSLTQTRKIKNTGRKSVFGSRWLRGSKANTIDSSKTNMEDGDVKMTLDEQIESLERMQKLIRQLAAEQGVLLEDGDE